MEPNGVPQDNRGDRPMYSGYEELNRLPAEEFLKWENFRTPFDSLPENFKRCMEQYNTGLQIGARSRYVSISCGSTWGAIGRDGSSTTSYEGIGFHSCTADLLKGFIDSGVPIVVWRLYGLPEGEPMSETWIQGQKPEGDVNRR